MEKMKGLPLQVTLLVRSLTAKVNDIAAAKTDVDREKALKEAHLLLETLNTAASIAAEEFEQQ